MMRTAPLLVCFLPAIVSGINAWSSSPITSTNVSVASVNPHGASQKWDGWGVSLAWWTKLFGDRDDVADAMFSLKDSVQVWGHYNVPGLGLNIARYNAGGSAWREFDGKRMVTSSQIPGYKQIEGYW